jgi:hypothetical protein
VSDERTNAIVEAHAIAILCELRGYSEDEVRDWLEGEPDEIRPDICDEIDAISEQLLSCHQTLKAFAGIR